MHTIEALAEDLAKGRTSARELLDGCLDRIADPDGEGSLAFLHVDADAARADADHADALRARGVTLSPLAGIPLSVKDLFDVSGQITRAGSIIIDGPPAARDAPCIARLRGAGMVIVGRTNMTEFAFSGLGLNAHYGTPASPWDRATRRIPGGSTSGGAVSVSDGMAVATVGSDTGGSCRVPAHCCGIVGFKPSRGRITLEGAYPLSSSLDSIGPLGNSVACCALLDRAMAGLEIAAPKALPVKGLRLAAPQTLVLDDLDDTVAAAYGQALAALAQAGAAIEEVACPLWAELPAINAKGGLAAAEAYALHGELIEQRGDEYDQRVKARILGGAAQSAADYIRTLNARARLIDDFARLARPYDAFVLPTAPQVAPEMAPLDADFDTYVATNVRMLRNTSLGNFLDVCAISLPCHRPGEPPVGLMLMAPYGADSHLLAVARGVEGIVSGPGR